MLTIYIVGIIMMTACLIINIIVLFHQAFFEDQNDIRDDIFVLSTTLGATVGFILLIILIIWAIVKHLI